MEYTEDGIEHHRRTCGLTAKLRDLLCIGRRIRHLWYLVNKHTRVEPWRGRRRPRPPPPPTHTLFESCLTIKLSCKHTFAPIKVENWNKCAFVKAFVNLPGVFLVPLLVRYLPILDFRTCYSEESWIRSGGQVDCLSFQFIVNLL